MERSWRPYIQERYDHKQKWSGEVEHDDQSDARCQGKLCRLSNDSRHYYDKWKTPYPKTISRINGVGKVVVFGKTKAQVIRESPEAVSVINAKELQGRSISLETILNKTIGLKVGQSGGLGSSSRIIVHGLEGNRIQILWDGIPMSTSDGTFSLDEIPIDIIERIEVYKSIIPARFGCDGLGGAVNIVTKEFCTDYLDASYELGSYRTHKGSVFSRKNFPKSGILLGAGGYYTSAKNDYSFRVPERENLLVKRDHDRFRSYMLKGKSLSRNSGSMKSVPSSGITTVSMRYKEY